MREKNNSTTAMLVIFLLGMVGAPSLAMVVWSRPAQVREIRLVARDMTFYLEGEDAPNPTLRVKRGEHVEIVLRNEDTGMTHDVSIRDWRVAVGPLQGKGQEAVRFRVPDAPGSAAYACTPHAGMMRGSIVVE